MIAHDHGPTARDISLDFLFRSYDNGRLEQILIEA
jgi:hypothetical protein